MGRYRTAKYRNQRVQYGDQTFDSKRERDRYIDLSLLESAGKISNLRLQPRYILKCSGEPLRYPSGRKLVYVADFEYEEDGKVVIEDTKGYATNVYKIKRAIMEANGYSIRET